MNIKKIVFTLLAFITLNVTTVYASGSIDSSKSSITLEPGASTTFVIKATNAAGRVDIASSDTSIATVSSASEFLDNSSATITVKAVKVGSAKITITLKDAATYDEETLSGTRTVNVTVKEKETTTATKKTTTTTKKGTTTTTRKGATTSTTTTTKSVAPNSNASLKRLEVKGYLISKEDDFNYKLDVQNIDKITIEAEAENANSKITGLGEKSIKDGTNIFKVVVISPNGLETNTYTITVYKKSETNETNILSALNTTSKEVDIKIEDGKVLSKNELQQILSKKKTVNLIKYENNEMLYKWIIDGESITKVYDIKTDIDINKEDEKFDKATDYRNGVYLDFAYSGNLPQNTKVAINVKDKYKDGQVLSLYYYNEKKGTLTLSQDKIKVENGQAVFNLEHCSKYFLSEAMIKEKSINYYRLIAFVELLVIIGLVYIEFYKKNKRIEL